MLSPPFPSEQHSSLCPSLWSASSASLVCIQRSLSWDRAWEKAQKWRTHHLTKQGRREGTKEERKRGGRVGENNQEGSGRKLVQLPVESRILRKKGRLQSDFLAKDRAGFFFPDLHVSLGWSTTQKTSSYLPPFSAFPSARSGRHINHSGCPSVFLSCGLLPMVSKAADRPMPDTWLFGSWVERGVVSLCADFNVPWIQFALPEHDTYAQKEWSKVNSIWLSCWTTIANVLNITGQ